MRARRHVPDKYSIFYTLILHVYSLVSIDTLAYILKKFRTCLCKCKDICYTIVKMSEYSMMGKYSLLGCHISIM